MVITSPVTLSRRHVLGDFYARCLPIARIPVYLDSEEAGKIGFVDEGLGAYADAFQFHLSDEICKKLLSGHYTYSFQYDYADKKTEATARRRIRLTSILLNSRKGYAKPQPKTKAVAVETE
ncbi:MAG: hypothetical protein ABI878_05635 [Acidobacteriota bacterium]